METVEKQEERKCPKCGSETNQAKSGFTGCGSQRILCGKCKYKYSQYPLKRRYAETERKAALRMITDGATGRAVGRQFNMSKANAYRWAREEAQKKGFISVDKSQD